MEHVRAVPSTPDRTAKTEEKNARPDPAENERLQKGNWDRLNKTGLGWADSKGLIFIFYVFTLFWPAPETQRAHERALELVSGIILNVTCT